MKRTRWRGDKKGRKRGIEKTEKERERRGNRNVYRDKGTGNRKSII